MKDEPTTALIGTLAQSYAYNDDIQNAIEYFEMSKEYSLQTKDRTASYLFTLYHRIKDVEKTHFYFKEQTGKTAEQYAEKKDFSESWYLLSYCKLRALELHKKGKTNLPSVDLKETEQYKSGKIEYPFPLIMKWEGIARWLEEGELAIPVVESYFTEAINCLLREDCGFAIKALALPIIQCYALVNNQNLFHAKYLSILDGLGKSSPVFAKYVESKAILLKSIKNGEDIWQRAVALPFIYA